MALKKELKKLETLDDQIKGFYVRQHDEVERLTIIRARMEELVTELTELLKEV